MNWWHKLKERILHSRGSKTSSGGRSARVQPRLPSSIVALCTHRDQVFSIEITSLSLSGVRLTARHAIEAPSQLTVRVPVGLNFENRDTQEYVVFSLEAVWARKIPRGTEVGGRYVDGCNAKRDRWMEMVMEAYGLSLADDTRRECTRYPVKLPVSLRALDDDAPTILGQTLNISTGGLLVSVDHEAFHDGQAIHLELGPVVGADMLPLYANVVHCHQEQPEQAWYLGIRFDELSPEQRAQLLRLVSTLADQVRAQHESACASPTPT